MVLLKDLPKQRTIYLSIHSRKHEKLFVLNDSGSSVFLVGFKINN